jgi:hypothetical protein
LLVHALEFTEESRELLREVWRVMSGSARLLILVPNRAGLWARTERSPFGQGRPFSPSQLGQLLRETQFTPTSYRCALYLPPTRSRLLLRLASPLERLIGRFSPPIGGVILIEAAKQVYAARPGRRRARGRPRAAALAPFARRTAAPLTRPRQHEHRVLAEQVGEPRMAPERHHAPLAIER